jgi:hypothetical protein
MNQTVIDMLTPSSMFVDEDDYVALAIAAEAEASEELLIQPFGRGANLVPRYGMPTTVMRKPTKEEALDRLPYVPRLVRRPGRRLPPPFGIPFWAIDLAEVLVELDPLDRIEG